MVSEFTRPTRRNSSSVRHTSTCRTKGRDVNPKHREEETYEDYDGSTHNNNLSSITPAVKYEHLMPFGP